MAGWIALALLLLAALAIVLRGDAGTIHGWSVIDLAGGALVLALVIVTAAPLLRRYEGRIGLAFRDFSIWGVAGLALVTLYAYRAEVPYVADRLLGELAPPGTLLAVPSPIQGERLVQLRRRPNGHFVAEAGINGTPTQVVIDTGASIIVLTALDAQRAGIDTAGLAFSVPVQTANGTAFAAHVRLQTVSVGPVAVPGLDALIAKPGSLDESLLGMNFLSRLKSYEFSGDFLMLRG